MSSVSLLLILIGIFIIVNSKNLVDVFNGKLKFNLDLTAPSTQQAATSSPSYKSSSGG